MKPKKKPIPHVCKFMKTCKTLDLLYPAHMKYAKIRRKFRELLLVSEENGRRCYTPQGNAGYIYQKEKQLTQSFHIIHPYSKFCEYWKIFAVLEYAIGYTVRTFLVSLFPDMLMNHKYQIPSLLADLFESADVWLRFNIGYVDKEMQEVVLESRKVVLHTLKRWSFYTDAIFSFPLDFSLYLYAIVHGYPVPVLKYCVLLKITKSYTMARYLMHMGKIYNWDDLWLRIVWMLFLNFLFSHFVTCAFHLIVRDTFFEGTIAESSEKCSCFYYYIRVFYVVTCIFFGHQGIGDNLFSDGITDKLFYCFMILMLHFNSVVFNGTFLHLLAFTRNSKVVFDEMKQEVQKFLAQENLPKHVHVKALKYLDFRYSQSYFNEELILNTLSPPLRREVVKFLCLDLIKKPNSVFHSLPDEVLTDLCLLMKLEYFLAGDTIFKYGEKSKKIYFLYSGSVAVYSPTGKEIMHWYEGQQFGTSSFSRRPLHPVTAIALEITETYQLLYTDFIAAVDGNPEYVMQVNEAATGRVKYLVDLFATEYTNTIYKEM